MCTRGANPEAEGTKSSVVGERRLLACGVYRDICGGVCLILPPETRQQHAVMSLRHWRIHRCYPQRGKLTGVLFIGS